MFFTALMSIVQSAIQATVIHSFCLHCGTHSKFIWAPPTMKHNVTVNVYNVMEKKTYCRCQNASDHSDKSLIMLYNNW